ncbi:MAG: MotA/TolQ/ExbB proton channel family protein [Opitutaceae bacterium]|nr:MotA/TolQ/ExbB proton channel family protein [Opitutaceae bacterium]
MNTPIRTSVLFVAATFCVLAAPSFAQEAAAAANTVALAETKTLFDKIMLAGPSFMLILFLSSVFMVWLIIDGLIRTAKPKLVPPPVLAAVRQHLIDGDYESAAGVAIASDTAFGNVAAAAFTKVGLGKDATDDAIFEETERARGVFNARISYLSVIGVITPMVGLTGTVFGMIQAFDTLGSSGVGDPSKLSEAIGHVLVCTGGGLIVAIPAFAFYYVMRNRISAGFRHLQVQINAIFHHLPYEHLQGLRLETDAFVPAPPRAQSSSTQHA